MQTTKSINLLRLVFLLLASANSATVILNTAAELRGDKTIPRPENDSQPAR